MNHPRLSASSLLRLFLVGGVFVTSSVFDPRPSVAQTTLQSSSQAIQYISPVPGSSLVSQQTNIILRTDGTLDRSFSSNPAVLVVQGSVSGEHTGSLVLSDDDRTLVFNPTTAFSPGETVTVNVRSGIRTTEGQDIGPLTFQFGVTSLSSSEQKALLIRLPNSEIVPVGSVFPAGSSGRSLQKAASDSLPGGYPSPVIVQSSDPTPGSIFLTTFKLATINSVPQLLPSNEQYATIVDNSGSPIYFKRMSGLSTDFKVQPTGVLTYFDAAATAFYALDSTYTVVDSFRCGNGYTTDVHELLLLPNGHSVLLGLDPQEVDMSTVVPGGYPYATVIGMVIQELDQARNVVFQWRTFDHFKITDATHEDLLAKTIDYVHSNAIDIDSDGNFLLSSRHLDEITKIDRQTGVILWRWGGKNNQFTFVNDTIGFSHQHSIRRTPTGTLILFDDGNFHTPQISRAVEYTLDEQAKSVNQIWEFRHSPDLYAFAMGSVQRLSNGNTIIGWGMATGAAVTEVRPDGGVAFELRLPDSVVSYRAFRFPWQPSSVVTAISGAGNVPEKFSLAQNYPNPFNPSTIIQYSLPRQSDVKLTVYDVVGREVATLVDGTKAPGTYSVRFDASRFASGIYFYRLTSSGQALTKLMTLIK